jgi:frataxin-like iron-binding protein CyaY
MIAIRLDKDINPNYILHKIQHEINEHRKNNEIQNSILYIEIKNTAQVYDELILKLEHTLEKLDDDRKHDLPESA